MTNEIAWVNYGDVNPIEHGGIFVQQENETTFRIVKIRFDDDVKKNIIHDLYVDISDDWIEEKLVTDYSGIIPKYDENYNVLFAIACTDYYSRENFGCFENVFVPLSESAEYLKRYGIEIE